MFKAGGAHRFRVVCGAASLRTRIMRGVPVRANVQGGFLCLALRKGATIKFSARTAKGALEPPAERLV